MAGGAVGSQKAEAAGVASAASLLRTQHLSVSFGDHKAVNDITASFSGGKLTAIVGPNGAGKTTYFNLISGQIKSTAGAIWLGEEDITGCSAALRAVKGLGRAFQLTNLFPRLTVLENVRLAIQAKTPGAHRNGFNFWSIWSDSAKLVDQAVDILASVSMAQKRDAIVGNLSHGDQRKLEVAMLIAMDPKVYMFDEPTAGMSIDEAPIVLELIRGLKALHDKTILLVEHKMDVVRDLADRIIVLHNGELVADGEPAAVIASPIVQEAYLGTPAAGSQDP